MMQKKLKPWNMGNHLRVLSESFLMNTNMTGFRCFSVFIKSLHPYSLDESSLSIGRVQVSLKFYSNWEWMELMDFAFPQVDFHVISFKFKLKVSYACGPSLCNRSTFNWFYTKWKWIELVALALPQVIVHLILFILKVNETCGPSLCNRSTLN